MDTEWLKPEATARGSVIVIAGRGEHRDVYGRFARRIAYDGYRVAVTENDSAAVDRTIASAQADLPVTLIGSDSGALTALAAAATSSVVAGAVAAGILVVERPGTEAHASARDLADELDIRSACPVHREVLSSTDALVPGKLGQAAPFATAKSLAQVPVPVLVVHGQVDILSPVSDVLALSSSLPDIRVVVVHEGRHDILNDVSHRSVAAEIVQFLERLRLPGAPDLILREPAGALTL